MKGLRLFVCFACAGLILALVGCGKTPTAGNEQANSPPKNEQDQNKKLSEPNEAPDGGKLE